MKRLSNYFSGSIHKFLFMPYFKGEYLGLKFSLSFIPLIVVEVDNSSYLKICLIKKSSFRLRIKKSIKGKRLGIVQKIKTNDEIFNKEFLISSNKPYAAIDYLNSGNKKGIIRELFFNSGFNYLKITGSRIVIEKPTYNPHNPEIDLVPTTIKNILEKLILLASGL